MSFFTNSVASTCAMAVAMSAMMASPGAARAAETGKKTPPNILFLYTDEQRMDTLRCYGNTRGIMPNLDRIAAKSTVFEHAYCTQPVCTPSRGSILTGLYSHAHGAMVNNTHFGPNTKCFPEYLPAGLFATGHFGKWHLGNEIFAQHGFSDWRATEDTYQMTYSPPVQEYGPERSAYHHWLIKQGVQPINPKGLKPGDPNWHPVLANRFFREQIHALPEEFSRPTFLAEQAIDFIQTNTGKPWTLFVNFLEPHPPFNSCRDKQYAPEEVTLAPNWQERIGPERPLRLQMAVHAGPKTEKDLREITARYWGMCSLVDTQVGRILKVLEEKGLSDNTIIVLTTDHGEMLGSYGLTGKGYMFEESSRVPFFVHLPGQTQERRIAAPVSQLDITPTLLELVGQTVPEHLHGKSLKPLLTGEQTTTGRDVFIQWETAPALKVVDEKPAKPLKPGLEKLGTPEQLAAASKERTRTIVTTDKWKYNHNSLGLHELYDLNTDPHERRNLAQDPAHKERVQKLQQRIVAWQKTVADPG